MPYLGPPRSVGLTISVWSGVNYRFKIISHTGLYSSRYNCVQNCTVLYLPVGLLLFLRLLSRSRFSCGFVSLGLGGWL